MNSAFRHSAPIAIDRLGATTMGTTWSISIVAPGRDLSRLHDRMQTCLDRVVAQMSHWEADSDLSRYNRAKPGWIALPEPLLMVLECACEVAAASDGAFDPTLGELAALWGFGPQGAVASPPTSAQVDAARARAGWQRLEIDRANGCALQPGDLRLDLSAIAKGHAVDLVCGALRADGVASALVEVGGELAGFGRKPDGSRWQVLVETAHDVDANLPAEVVRLEDCAVATSGDRWHRHRHGTMEYAHTLDPRTGRPLPRAPLAATVIAADAMRADAWATALSVLERDAAFALAQQCGIALRLVEAGADGAPAILRTPEFERYIAA